MDRYQKTIRLCACLLLWAVLYRLGTTGFFNPLITLLTGRQAMEVIWFLETGRRFPVTEPSQPTQPTGNTAPTQPTEVSLPDSTAPGLFFDAGLVQINSYCGYEPQVEAWMEQPLTWELRQEAPTVLILHSHATEGYENAPYRTEDPTRNMISVGDYLVQRLEQAGIHALHDRTLHDAPSYTAAYGNARASLQHYLQTYPEIRLVLDLHRDACEDAEGNQLPQTVPGTDTARLMLVVGSDAGGLSHSRWPENMALAVKLHAALEQMLPGICRPISFRTQRFNQDLSTGALLVEIGAAGNTHHQALEGAKVLADAIIALAEGSDGKK